MELFERIRKLTAKLEVSQAKFAESLSIHPRTLNGWMSAERQDNFWPVLPKILEVYPRLSRQWLYFEEGPMFIGKDVPLNESVPMQEVQTAIEQMARDASGMNKTIYQLIAGQAVTETPDAAEKIRRLEEELYAERKLNRQLTTKLLLGDSAEEEATRAAGRPA